MEACFCHGILFLFWIVTSYHAIPTFFVVVVEALFCQFIGNLTILGLILISKFLFTLFSLQTGILVSQLWILYIYFLIRISWNCSFISHSIYKKPWTARCQHSVVKYKFYIWEYTNKLWDLFAVSYLSCNSDRLTKTYFCLFLAIVGS